MAAVLEPVFRGRQDNCRILFSFPRHLETLLECGNFVCGATVAHTKGTRLFGLADAVWPFWSEPFRSEPFRSETFPSGRFGLAVSVTGHFGRDIFVHKELMKFVKVVNVNKYLGRIMIYPHNTRQTKSRQFALPKPRSKSGAKMIKYSAIEISSKIPSEIKNITCFALFAAKYKKYGLLGYQKHTLCSYWCT